MSESDCNYATSNFISGLRLCNEPIYFFTIKFYRHRHFLREINTAGTLAS